MRHGTGLAHGEAMRACTGKISSKAATNLFDSSLYGCLLMLGYLGFDGFTSTWQDKMFKGYSMSIYNQILYVQLCSAGVSLFGLVTSMQVRPARCRPGPCAARGPTYHCRRRRRLAPL